MGDARLIAALLEEQTSQPWVSRNIMALFRKDDALPKPLQFMAAITGLVRAFSSGDKNSGGRRDKSHSGRRGRAAATPSDIPAKGWWDIAWRVITGTQEDRVMLVAAGVTFYALLALFPATAALVSLYGLFTDPGSISQHLNLVSGFLPQGAIDVIGDQVNRISAQGTGTLGVTFVGTLLLSLWS